MCCSLKVEQGRKVQKELQVFCSDWPVIQVSAVFYDFRLPTPDIRMVLPRKEVIQPHLPIRLPCYDFTPITDPTFDGCFPALNSKKQIFKLKV